MRLAMTTRLAIVGTSLALTVASAQAQMGGQNSGLAPGTNSAMGIGRHAQSAEDKSDALNAQKLKANDKAYNSALKNLPDKQYDPWHGVR